MNPVPFLAEYFKQKVEVELWVPVTLLIVMAVWVILLWINAKIPHEQDLKKIFKD